MDEVSFAVGRREVNKAQAFVAMLMMALVRWLAI